MWPHPRRTEPLKGAIADARRTRKMVRTTLSAKVMPAISLSLTPERSGSKAAPSVFAAARIWSRIKQLLPPPSGAGEAFGLLGDAEQRLRLVDAFLLLETQQTSRSSITDHKAGG